MDSLKNSWDLLDIPEGEFDAYLFDCDGTLVDSMPIHHGGWVHALRELGSDYPFPYEELMGLAGIETRKMAAYLTEKTGIHVDYTEIAPKKRAYYMSQLENLQRIKPVADFAEHIAQTHPVAVVTGGLRDIVTESLKITGLLDLFPVLVNFEDVKHGKPAPDMMLKAAERLDVDPRKCLVFEDGILGIESAHAAGMQTVFIEDFHR